MGTKKDSVTTSKSMKPQNTADLKAPKFNTVVAEMAWQIAIPFLVFILGGNWLDGRQGTEPLFTVIGVFLAFASVGLILKRILEKYNLSVNGEAK